VLFVVIAQMSIVFRRNPPMLFPMPTTCGCRDYAILMTNY